MPPQDTHSANNTQGLLALANAYFDAAYAMDADRFAPLFAPTASITRRGDGDSAIATPVAAWLDAVRALPSPQAAGDARDDRILALLVAGDMALLQLRLRIAPREVTDLLSCYCLDGRWQIVQKVFVACAH